MEANRVPFEQWFKTMHDAAIELELYEMMAYLDADGVRLSRMWKTAKESDRLGWMLLVDAATRRLDWKLAEIETLL